jgi:multidrug efflux pump subunit AcrA (membrane-fusion protein)
MNNYLTTDIEKAAVTSPLTSFSKVYRINKKSSVKHWLWGMLILFIATMILPWTQNIRAKGTVTTLRQEQRPQELNTIIPGRVIKWYVKEGDFVKEGDTILQLGEVKIDYFDPQLLART